MHKSPKEACVHRGICGCLCIRGNVCVSVHIASYLTKSCGFISRVEGLHDESIL